MPGLPEYLAAKRTTLAANTAAQRSAYDADPSALAATLQAVTTSDDRTGLRKVTVRQHSLLVDNAPATGGFDLAPGSPELLVAALSSCVVHTAELVAAQLEVPVRSITADTTASIWTGHLAGLEPERPRGPEDFTVALNIDAPEATAAQLAALRQAVDDTCLLVQTLRRANAVTVVAGSSDGA